MESPTDFIHLIIKIHLVREDALIVCLLNLIHLPIGVALAIISWEHRIAVKIPLIQELPVILLWKDKIEFHLAIIIISKKQISLIVQLIKTIRDLEEAIANH